MSHPGPFSASRSSLFCGDGSLEHRRTKVRGVLERFGESVIGQEAEPVCITSPDVHIAGVIPTLRGVFKLVDRADREGGAGDRDIRGEDGVIDKADSRMGTSRLDQARARLRVVDEMGALKVKSALHPR